MKKAKKYLHLYLYFYCNNDAIVLLSTTARLWICGVKPLINFFKVFY